MHYLSICSEHPKNSPYFSNYLLRVIQPIFIRITQELAFNICKKFILSVKKIFPILIFL